MSKFHPADAQELRRRIDEAIAAGEARTAQGLLAELWRQSSGPATASFIASRFERLRPALEARPCKLALLRSFTLEPAVPVLRAAAAVYGIDLTVEIGGFNCYAQEIFDSRGSLYSFAPEIVVLAVQTRDITPDLWDDFADLDSEGVRAAVERAGGAFSQLIDVFRAHSQASLIVHTLESPDSPRNGVFDTQCEEGQAAAIRAINRAIVQAARRQRGVYLLDYDALVARHGRKAWNDEEKWVAMRMPIAAECLPILAQEWLRLILPLTGKVCKVLVADVDHTLWGGIVGEDGLAGIQVGNEPAGAPYRALQRVMLDLYRRGVLLALCSKNDAAEALNAIERHPGMLLRRQHFAAMRINWSDKAQNLREIAAELNVGLDALAFLDDNPVERQWIRSQLPEVTVIELPDMPAGYAGVLRDCPLFERVAVSVEDRERSRYYAEQRLRVELRQSHAHLEDFYRSLHMQVEVAAVTSDLAPRVAQLTQKTSQFNLTTRRYSEQQIAAFIGDPNWRVFGLRARDRFGDYGLVGVAVVHHLGPAWEIDTLLLSCRVIGRTVETALLAAITDQARAEGGQRIIGLRRPTRKNAPAKDLYSSHGFLPAGSEDGIARWEFDLVKDRIECPPWIQLRSTTSEMTA